MSTGGQLGGISRYTKTYRPDVKVIGVDAVGSAIFGGESHSYLIPGIGLAWTPCNIAIENIDSVYKVTDEAAFVSARCFARSEGILMGPSSGACALVALTIAKKLSPSDCVVCIISDGGDRYIQTLFDDAWMQSNNVFNETSLKKLLELTKEVAPWSIHPAQNANYKPELINKLRVPTTTPTINENIDETSRSIPRISFID